MFQTAIEIKSLSKESEYEVGQPCKQIDGISIGSKKLELNVK
jgi:hypothetical protein